MSLKFSLRRRVQVRLHGVRREVTPKSLKRLRSHCRLRDEDGKSLLDPADDDRDTQGNTLASDLRRGMEEESFSDFTIACSGLSFSCHRLVLASRSPVLKMILSNNSAEAKESALKMTDAEPGAVRVFLRYLYTDRLELPREPCIGEGDLALAANVLRLAHKYDVPLLAAKCSAHMLENMCQENASDILRLARRFGLRELEERAKHFVTEEAGKVIRTESWKELVMADPAVATDIISGLVAKEK